MRGKKEDRDSGSKNTWLGKNIGNVIQTCRDGIWKAKVQMELNLVRDVKNNKGFYIDTGQKRQAREIVTPCNKYEERELVSMDI